MAISASQVLALVESHAEGDDHRFYTTVLQMAAKEARAGHNKIAEDLSDKVKKYQFKKKVNSSRYEQNLSSDKDLQGLIELYLPYHRMSELFLNNRTKNRINLIINEYRQKDNLKKYDLYPRKKLLFVGPPGTGKTLSASVLASELKLPLYKIVLETVISKYMGDTATHLKTIFNFINSHQGVFLFDEFDAIGANRTAKNDVGESRRILNSFLILLEQLQSDSIVIAATNHPQLLDNALNRRFDDIIPFDLPTFEEVKSYLENRISIFPDSEINWKVVADFTSDLSLGDIEKAFNDGAKDAILNNQGVLNTDYICRSLKRRKENKME